MHGYISMLFMMKPFLWCFEWKKQKKQNIPAGWWSAEETQHEAQFSICPASLVWCFCVLLSSRVVSLS